MRRTILIRLSAIAAAHNVRVLLAIESGSRAWGFASPNSDYDVRFIYAHPRDWYLSIDLERRRDVIEYPIVDNLDLNGWDVRKALQLFWQSNPALVEWLQSPITYIDHGDYRAQMLALLPRIYAQQKGMYHYLNMAKNHYYGYLQGERVVLKKYFYVLRPLLAIRWLHIRQTPAPIEFARLLAMVDDDALLDAIHTLLAEKSVSTEKTLVARHPLLDAFIRSEITRHERDGFPKRNPPSRDINLLNKVFIGLLQDAV